MKYSLLIFMLANFLSKSLITSAPINENCSQDGITIRTPAESSDADSEKPHFTGSVAKIPEASCKVTEMKTRNLDDKDEKKGSAQDVSKKDQKFYELETILQQIIAALKNYENLREQINEQDVEINVVQDYFDDEDITDIDLNNSIPQTSSSTAKVIAAKDSPIGEQKIPDKNDFHSPPSALLASNAVIQNALTRDWSNMMNIVGKMANNAETSQSAISLIQNIVDQHPNNKMLNQILQEPMNVLQNNKQQQVNEILKQKITSLSQMNQLGQDNLTVTNAGQNQVQGLKNKLQNTEQPTVNDTFKEKITSLFKTNELKENDKRGTTNPVQSNYNKLGTSRKAMDLKEEQEKEGLVKEKVPKTTGVLPGRQSISSL